MRRSRIILGTVLSLSLSATASAGSMVELRGLTTNEGCLKPATVATEKLRTCPVADDRVRIWCPNGRVFDRDSDNLGVAILRSICEMNQLTD